MFDPLELMSSIARLLAARGCYSPAERAVTAPAESNVKDHKNDLQGVFSPINILGKKKVPCHRTDSVNSHYRLMSYINAEDECKQTLMQGNSISRSAKAISTKGSLHLC